VAHHDPVQLISVAAVVATVTAAGGLLMAARSKHESGVRMRQPELALSAEAHGISMASS
jgi:hypothetical protein